MSEQPTASKRQRCNSGTPQVAPIDQQQQVTSSSSTNEKSDEQIFAPNLLSEADLALQESNKRHLKPVVDESKLGIELFVGDRSKQFHGLIKARYADFIVHEIDLEGEAAILNSLEPPEDEDDQHSDSIKLEDLFDRKLLVCLSNVSQGLLESYRIDVTGMNKDMRTSIHHAIKAEYDKLESSTVSDNNVPVFKKQGKDNQDKGTEDADEPMFEEDVQTEKSNEEPDEAAQQVSDDKPVAGDAKESSTKAEEREESPTQQAASDQGEEKKYILVKRRNKNTRPKSVWPRNRPDHTHFILYKENKDTMDAIHNIAMVTHSKPAHYGYAGTKDRRAVTSQWVSSWRLEPRRLMNAMRRFNKRPFLKVGNFCFKKDPIRLGQLRANKFDIVIRHLIHNSGGVKVIDEAMEYVKENGFVNYFGLQRFGTRSISTHEVGLAILQGKWDKAVEMILSYRYDDNMQILQASSQDNNESSQQNQQTTGDGSETDSSQHNNNNNNNNNNNGGNSQQLWKKRQEQAANNTRRQLAGGAEQHNACIDLWKSKQDADLVFKKYPQFKNTIEGSIIRALSKPPNSATKGQDHAAAIASLARNTRSMYVHSYQSLLWNKLTTLRLKKFGYKVIPGDLILCPEANISDNSLDILLTVDEHDSPAEVAALKPEETVDKVANQDRKMPVEEIDSNIVYATEENLDKYSIFDVVLPLIGTKTRVPTNEVGQELERLLQEDNLTLESFKARERAFISYGSYRKIMVRPNNLSWSVKQYSHPNENLIDTDLDLINRREVQGRDRSTNDKRPIIESDSSDEALIVGFELPPSSYATMCLRELMKKPSTDFNNRF